VHYLDLTEMWLPPPLKELAKQRRRFIPQCGLAPASSDRRYDLARHFEQLQEVACASRMPQFLQSLNYNLTWTPMGYQRVLRAL